MSDLSSYIDQDAAPLNIFCDDETDVERMAVIKSSEMNISPSDSSRSSTGTSSTRAAPQNASSSQLQATLSTEQPQSALVSKPRLQELVREIDPTEQLDEEVEEMLLQVADDFVENTVNAACMFAKHRKVSKVEVRDVQLYLEQNWNMWIPGFGTEELRPYKRAAVTEAHKQRLALIRKAIKKY